MDTLAVRLTVPLAGPVEDLHLQVVRPTTTVDRTAPNIGAMRHAWRTPVASRPRMILGKIVRGYPLLDELASHKKNVQAAERVLYKEAQKHPGVQVLMSIPGVGIRTAECLVAYIDNPGRFSSKKKVASYFGLIPSLDSSAGKHRLGHITKQGPPTARCLLTEASWSAVRKSDTVRAYYERIMKGDPDRKKIAIIATAHYLLRVSLKLLETGELWEEAV